VRLDRTEPLGQAFGSTCWGENSLPEILAAHHGQSSRQAAVAGRVVPLR
jgi:hypothetical protein